MRSFLSYCLNSKRLVEIRQSQVGDNKTNEIQSMKLQNGEQNENIMRKRMNRLTRITIRFDADDTWTLLIACIYLFIIVSFCHVSFLLSHILTSLVNTFYVRNHWTAHQHNLNWTFFKPIKQFKSWKRWQALCWNWQKRNVETPKQLLVDWERVKSHYWQCIRDTESKSVWCEPLEWKRQS